MTDATILLKLNSFVYWLQEMVERESIQFYKCQLTTSLCSQASALLIADTQLYTYSHVFYSLAAMSTAMSPRRAVIASAAALSPALRAPSMCPLHTKLVSAPEK